MTVIVSCIFRPLDAREQLLKSRKIVKFGHNKVEVLVWKRRVETPSASCDNNPNVVKVKSMVEKRTRKYRFYRVFGLNSNQVSICSFLIFL